MTRVTLNAEHFGNHLQPLSGFTKHLKTNAAADIGQVSRQVYKGSFRADIFWSAQGHYVSATGLVPLRFDLQACKIAWSSAVFGFYVARHNKNLRIWSWVFGLRALALGLWFSFCHERFGKHKGKRPKAKDQSPFYSSSALNFSSTEKSSSVVTSPTTEPLVAISRRSRRIIFPDLVFGNASVNRISSGRARAPISFTTWARNS